MLDQLIEQTAASASYSPSGLRDIEGTLNHLKNILINNPEFRDPYLGGSYKRATLVREVSDVDVYIEYTSSGSPLNALNRLKTCLQGTYTKTEIRKDRPSVWVEFQTIPINVTPYKESGGIFTIPNAMLSGWEETNMKQLEIRVKQLRQQNEKFIDLIKVLKVWNCNLNKGIRNFKIEENVCTLFLQDIPLTNTPGDWMITFFKGNGFKDDAQKAEAIGRLMPQEQEAEWRRFLAVRK